MRINYCSKPQQFNTVTQTPLVHRSHSCMRALALGHDIMNTRVWFWLFDLVGITNRFQAQLDS